MKYEPGAIPGRGTATQTPNRFERLHFEPDAPEDIGPVGPGAEEAFTPISPRTQFLKDHSRSVLTENDSPDVGFSRSINPYRGCEHGCAYCYARPTHEYLGMSAGLDFETKIFVKEHAPELLREALMKPGYRPEVIAVSGVTDCYQPVERRLRLTRRCLEVMTELKNPFIAITKNHLITRDVDLFASMARIGAAGAFVTITTLDPDLCAVLEPRTSRPSFRLDAIHQLAEAGVPVGVMVAPVIPGLTDHELPSILSAAAKAGARHAGFVPIRLPLSVRPLFEEWLGIHYPDRKEKVLNRIREMRGGKLNDPRFVSRMRGEGVFAEQIRALFKLYCRKERLNEREMPLTAAAFARPGDQLALF